MIDIEKNKHAFEKMYEYYKKRITSVSYPKKELEKITKKDLQKYPNLKEEEILKKIRTSLLTKKYYHSLRVYTLVDELNNIMNNNNEFRNLSDISGLLHDYGRFIQATLFNSYDMAETFFIENGLTGHGEVGARILFNLDEIKNFEINQKYYEILKKVIENHSLPTLGIYNKQIDENFYKKDIFKDQMLTTSCALQMVKDADMCDILYQKITGEYQILSQTFEYHVNNMSIDEISKRTGVDIETINYWNNIENNDLTNMKKIKLPLLEVDPSLLEVPEKIKKLFFNKVYITDSRKWDLQTMKKDQSYNYNSIIAMWWTIGQFIGNMNFKASLELIKEKNILEQIYDKYPEKYKYLVKDMFEFATQELLNERIKDKKIYAKKTI